MTIDEIRTEIIQLGKLCDVNITCPIEINSRLKSTLGRVCYKWINPYEETIIPSKIEFSKQYIETATDEDIKNVVSHEAAHAIIAYKTHKRHGHDAMWKELHKKLGGDGERCSTAPRIHAKYSVVCSKCGAVVDEYYRAGKVVKHPDWYSSSCCDAPLRVFQNY